MQNRLTASSPNFQGIIYTGGRKIKGMYFCKFGDQKIRLSLEYKSILLTVNDITPENIKPLNFIKRFFYRIDKKQNKLLEKIQNGTFNSFTYKLNEKEYNSIKRKPYLFFNKKELGKFEENVKTYIQPTKIQNLRRIFY